MSSFFSPVPPTHVKLTVRGCSEWNVYVTPNNTLPLAIVTTVFVVRASVQEDQVYKLEHPVSGHNLYMSANMCIGVQYNTTTSEWEEIP